MLVLAPCLAVVLTMATGQFLDSDSYARSEVSLNEDSAQRTASNWLIGSGAGLFAASYGVTVAVSLASDPDCQGPVCKERYLSIIPVIGPLIQIAVAGTEFHDEHHSEACIPRIGLAVGAQSLGLAALIVGAALREAVDEPDNFVHRTVISFDSYNGQGLGLSVSMRL